MRLRGRLMVCVIPFICVLAFSGQVFAEAVQARDEASWEVYPKVFGNSIPKDYFVTAGRGDADIGPGDD